MQHGKRVIGMRKPVILTTLSTTKPGEVFEFHIETVEPIADENAVIDKLLSLEQTIPDLKVTYIEARGQTIVLQFTDIGPGDIHLWALWDLLPTLLIAVVMGISIIALWRVWTTMPWLIAVAAGSAIFLYIMAKTKPIAEALWPPGAYRAPVITRTGKEEQEVLRPIVQYEGTREAIAAATERRLTLEGARKTIGDQLTEINRDIRSLKAQVKKTKDPDIKNRINQAEKARNELRKSQEAVAQNLRDLALEEQKFRGY